MKQLFKTLMVVLTLTISLFSCVSDESESVKPDLSKIQIEEPDYAALLLGGEDNRTPIYFSIHVESHFMGVVSPGCFQVLVNVFSTDNGTGQVTLIATEQVQVGDCGNNKIGSNSKCSGILPDGNLVIEDAKNKSKICLFELLTKNQGVYSKYQASVNELIEGVKDIQE